MKKADHGIEWRHGHAVFRLRVGGGRRVRCETAIADSAQAVARRALVRKLVASLVRARAGADVAEKVARRAAAADDEELRAIERVVAGVARGSHAPIGAARRRWTTFGELADAWTSGELADEFPDHVRRKREAYAHDDELRLAKHVLPHVRDVALELFTLDHADHVMKSLPRELAPATRRHVAQVMSTVLRYAVYPCRRIAVSPLPRGFLPKVPARKAKAWLYPDEEAKLLGCVAVPLVRRVLYGFLAREGMRASEALALAWRDLDLVRRGVRLDRNKTDDPRSWLLDPGTARALERWRELQGDPSDDELVFRDVASVQHLAETLRADLELAEIERPELFERTAQRARMRLHDLRGTFVTVALASGRTESWVRRHTGHKSSVQIATYERQVANLAELAVGWFADMAAAIPELAALGHGWAFVAPGGTSGGGDDEESAAIANDASDDEGTGAIQNPSPQGVRVRVPPSVLDENDAGSSADASSGGDGVEAQAGPTSDGDADEPPPRPRARARSRARGDDLPDVLRGARVGLAGLARTWALFDAFAFAAQRNDDGGES